MRALACGVLLSICACAEAPVATLVFAPFGDPDNCAASEADIVAGTQAVWVGVRDAQSTTIAAGCVETPDAASWDDLEDALVGAGAIIGDLPLGEPLAPFAMGLPDASCPSGDPSGGIRFCARADQPFTIDADDGGGRVPMRRICPATWSARDCFEP